MTPRNRKATGRPRKYPRWQPCEGCGLVFENLTGQPRRFHSVECAANHRPEVQVVLYVPPEGTPEREEYDQYQRDQVRIIEALAAAMQQKPDAPFMQRPARKQRRDNPGTRGVVSPHQANQGGNR
jgi:hypothetical protein